MTINVEFSEPTKEMIATLTTQVIVDGWGVFSLKGFGANIKRGNKVTERSVWASLETPADKVCLVAIPQHAGAGPQPKNTLTLTGVHDMINEIVRHLEWVLDDADKANTPNNAGW